MLWVIFYSLHTFHPLDAIKIPKPTSTRTGLKGADSWALWVQKISRVLLPVHFKVLFGGFSQSLCK